MFAVKIYAVPFDVKGTVKKWKEIGFDTVMTGRECLSDAGFIKEIHDEGIKLSIVEPVFLAPSEKELAEGASYDKAILQDGSAAIDDWVRFVCPTDTQRLSEVYERIKKDAALGADILTFDFARFFQFWEMVLPETPSSALKKSCFCPRCRKASAEYASEREWRTNTVTQAVKNCASAAKSVNSNVKTGVHIVPWKTDMFSACGDGSGGALESVLGQDLRALSECVDFLAPMTYHHMIHQPPAYIAEVIENHRSFIKDRIPVIPSVQVKELYRKEVLTRDEFREALRTALGAASDGLSFYQWTDIEESQESFDIIREEIENNGK